MLLQFIVANSKSWGADRESPAVSRAARDECLEQRTGRSWGLQLPGMRGQVSAPRTWTTARPRTPRHRRQAQPAHAAPRGPRVETAQPRAEKEAHPASTHSHAPVLYTRPGNPQPPLWLLVYPASPEFGNYLKRHRAAITPEVRHFPFPGEGSARNW